MKYYESNVLELKEKLNDKFVRETVAFLNTDGGTIIIGVKDDGTVIGVDNIDKTLKQIADVITDQIEPSATESVKPELLIDSGKILISVSVKKGVGPIYCIKKYGFSSVGCPVRVGSTCREMSEEEILSRYKQRLLRNDLMTEAVSNLPSLSFHSLKQYYLDKGYRLSDETFETNLNLIAASGQYNIMGEILSDNSRYSLIFVKFNGLNKASISQRTDYGKRSLLFAYEQLMNRIASENICISDTTVRPRKDTYLYDYDSVNEAVINAIVHNDWTVSEPQISFFSDRLEILSHGGLPHGLTEEEFYKGISKPRNMKLMKIFSDLDIVEHTGHGIPTIIAKYGKKAFTLSDNFIIATIPFNKAVTDTFISYKQPHFPGLIDNTIVSDLNRTEEKIVSVIISDPGITIPGISEKTLIAKRTVERYMAGLIKKGYIRREGSKKTGYWKILK